MQIFLIYLFLFIAGCMLGWLMEVMFRRFFSAKKWVNPGFMKGPWLPLYGFGLILMFTMCFLCVGLMPESMQFYNPLGNLFWREGVSGPTALDLIPIALMWVGMNLLEFIAGLIFIKGFRVKLWDYTNMRGNILGIVCPLFSLIWLLVSVIFYYGVNPFLFMLSTNMHTYMFGGEGQVAHFGFIFFMGVLYGFLIYDFITSVGVFAAISRFSREKGLLERYETVKEKWASSVDEAKKRMHVHERPITPNEKAVAVKGWLAKLIYIDPNKAKKTTENYDENGRPIKIDKGE